MTIERALIGTDDGSASDVDPNFENVSLLLHGDGTNGAQNNTFLDSSTNNFTITRNGNTTQGTFSPFNTTTPYSPTVNGGSGYFDGTGDYLTAANNAAWNFGTGDFTVECFAYVTSFSAGTTDVIISTYENASNGWTIGIFASTGYFYGAAAGDSARIDSTVAPSPQWNHLVLVRSGTTLSFFVNGARAGTLTNSTNISSTSALTIGTNVGGGALNFNGYMAGLRIVKGTAVYDPTQSTLTVPTAPLTAITNTSLLLSCTNAGIFDNAMKNDLETVGNAQISTSVKKYGTGSMAFDGSGDYLTVPSSPNLEFGSGDFTVEAWVHLTANVANAVGAYLTDFRNGNTNNFALGFIGSSGVTKMYDYVSNGPSTTGTSTVTLNAWHHVAWVRSGTTVTMYFNGAANGTMTSSYSQGPTGVTIGARYTMVTEYITGYVDDLRITKGVARYTANFTPPTAAFPNQ